MTLKLGAHLPLADFGDQQPTAAALCAYASAARRLGYGTPAANVRGGASPARRPPRAGRTRPGWVPRRDRRWCVLHSADHRMFHQGERSPSG